MEFMIPEFSRVETYLNLPPSEILPPDPTPYSLLKPSLTGIPIFAGEYVTKWLEVMEQFFYYIFIPSKMRLFTANFYLAGEPLRFLYGLLSASLLSTWDEFAEKLKLRFGNCIRPTLKINVWEASEEDAPATELEDFSVVKEDRSPVEEISGHNVDDESSESLATSISEALNPESEGVKRDDYDPDELLSVDVSLLSVNGFKGGKIFFDWDGNSSYETELSVDDTLILDEKITACKEMVPKVVNCAKLNDKMENIVDELVFYCVEIVPNENLNVTGVVLNDLNGLYMDAEEISIDVGMGICLNPSINKRLGLSLFAIEPGGLVHHSSAKSSFEQSRGVLTNWTPDYGKEDKFVELNNEHIGIIESNYVVKWPDKVGNPLASGDSLVSNDMFTESVEYKAINMNSEYVIVEADSIGNDEISFTQMCYTIVNDYINEVVAEINDDVGILDRMVDSFDLLSNGMFNSVISFVLGANPPIKIMERYYKQLWKHLGVEKVLLLPTGSKRCITNGGLRNVVTVLIMIMVEDCKKKQQAKKAKQVVHEMTRNKENERSEWRIVARGKQVMKPITVMEQPLETGRQEDHSKTEEQPKTPVAVVSNGFAMLDQLKDKRGQNLMKETVVDQQGNQQAAVEVVKGTIKQIDPGIHV
ncbi:OLC1v1030220C1 [Oldenlandia corymbosa var. corymbosa]|uniref:OLC1v1030220C1 n=1 Tax=Oldenlandia corymbosa var. corymbosa TaxID=529605 RepID=A0AAV1CFI0_OLDCO|nr:OLC1v1030220C1 [Oldenlandia corymbosa var. corymbosa]